MVIHQLQLENFMQYRNQTIDFREGLVSISGKNGAGKSTIFNAILFALYGDIRDKDSVRSEFADAGSTVLVQLTFEYKNVLYKITRQLKGKNSMHHALLYQNENELITSSVSHVREYISDLLKMDKEGFKKTIFSTQKELDDLTNASGEERRKLIRKILGLDQLDKIQQHINGDTKKIEYEISGIEQTLLQENEIEALNTLIEEKKQSLESQLLETKTLKKEKEHIESEIQNVNQELIALDTAQNNFNSINNTLTNYKKGVEGIKENINKLEEEKNNLEQLQKQNVIDTPKFEKLTLLKKELEQLTQLRFEFMRKENLTKESTRLESEYLVLKQKIEKQNEALSQKEALTSSLIQFQNENEPQKNHLENLKLTIENLKGQILINENEIKDLSQKHEKIIALETQANCPTCLQDVSNIKNTLADSFIKMIEERKSQIDQNLHPKLGALITDSNDILNILKNAENHKLNTEKEIERITAFVIDFEANQIQSKNLLNEINNIKLELEAIQHIQFDEAAYQLKLQEDKNAEPFYKSFEFNSAKLLMDIPKNIESLQTEKERLIKGNQFVAETEAKLLELNYNPSIHETKKLLKNELIEKDKNKVEAINKLKLKEIAINNEIHKCEAQLKKHFDSIQIIEKQQIKSDHLKQLKTLVESFKMHILERISPTISNEASRLFAITTKGRYEMITINDNFEFFVYDNGKPYPIQRFSGGEIDLCNICLRIALSKAIGELSGSQNIRFMAFDEIFGSQDEERRQEILQMFLHLQEQFAQIYIISHIDSIKDVFPNTLQVIRTPQGSEVSWSC
jgi:exonuclease SbcC